jgi:hypothetical protein
MWLINLNFTSMYFNDSKFDFEIFFKHSIYLTLSQKAWKSPYLEIIKL